MDHNLPCPFCGNENTEIDEIDMNVYAVLCDQCGCTGPIASHEIASTGQHQALHVWNQRMPIDHQTADIFDDDEA
jgi:Lar family restriction alleviation protein